MNIIVFGAWSYDVNYLEYIYPLFLENDVFYCNKPLNDKNIILASQYDTVYLFSNSKVDEKLLKILSSFGVENIVLRSENCYHYIDFESAEKYNINVSIDSEYFNNFF